MPGSTAGGRMAINRSDGLFAIGTSVNSSGLRGPTSCWLIEAAMIVMFSSAS